MFPYQTLDQPVNTHFSFFLKIKERFRSVKVWTFSRLGYLWVVVVFTDKAQNEIPCIYKIFSAKLLSLVACVSEQEQLYLQSDFIGSVDSTCIGFNHEQWFSTHLRLLCRDAEPFHKEQPAGKDFNTFSTNKWPFRCRTKTFCAAATNLYEGEVILVPISCVCYPWHKSVLFRNLNKSSYPQIFSPLLQLFYVDVRSAKIA